MTRQNNNFSVEYKAVDKETAISLQKQIEKFCEDHAVWFTVQHQNQPQLKFINMEISIKINS